MNVTSRPAGCARATPSQHSESDSATGTFRVRRDESKSASVAAPGLGLHVGSELGVSCGMHGLDCRVGPAQRLMLKFSRPDRKFAPTMAVCGRPPAGPGRGGGGDGGGVRGPSHPIQTTERIEPSKPPSQSLESRQLKLYVDSWAAQA